MKSFKGTVSIKQLSLYYVLVVSFLISTALTQTGGVIIIDNTPTNDSVISNGIGCKTYRSGFCIQCSPGYNFNDMGICQLSEPNCQSFDTTQNVCVSCYQGYIVIAGRCRIDNINPSDQDPGCRRWVNGKCAQCSTRWVFDQNRKCLKVDDACNTYDQTGQCLTCYNGFQLNQGKCIQQSNDQSVSNPFCKKWNGSICVECSYRAFFGQNNICQQVSADCNTWNQTNGQCLTCYQGFTLSNGACVASGDNGNLDPLCKKFDWQQQICLECSERSFKNQQGVCTEVNPLCKTYNQLACLSCYPGYTLSNGQCITQSTQPTDPGCARYDWGSKVCLQCSYRFYFNSQNICTKISDLCNTFDSLTGACLSCYQGYALNGTICAVSQNNDNNQQQSPDLNCQSYDAKTKTCLACSYRFVLDKNGKCIKVNDQCQTWDNSGLCTSCYQGYNLSSGVCTQSSTDSNCAKYDSTLKRCIQCATRYFLNSSSLCQSVSDQCQTFDNRTGYCTSCYQGYLLQNGQCLLQAEGCVNYNTQTGQCQGCSNEYCLNQNFTCARKPANCQTCAFQGGCSQCNPGYNLAGGVCVQQNGNNGTSRCKTQANGQCTSCNGNAILFDGVCITYAELKAILDYYQQNNAGNTGNTGNVGNTDDNGNTSNGGNNKNASNTKNTSNTGQNVTQLKSKN